MALVRGLVGYAPAVIFPRLVTLLQITLLTRFIPQAEFGRFVLVITVGDALDALCCNWIRIILARYGAGKPDALGEEAGRAYAIYAVLACAVALPIGFGLSRFQVVDPGVFFACIATYLLTNGIARHSLTLLSIRGLKLPFFLVEVARTGLGFIAVMSLAWSGAATTFAPLVMAMNAATAIAAAFGTVMALRGIGLRRPSHWGIDRWAYVVPVIAGALISVALNSSDRMVTEAFAGPVALATYAAAITLARQPLEFIFSVVNVRTFPELMEAYEHGGPEAGGERIGDLVSIMALLAMPAAIGLALVAEPLAHAFLPPAYVETARVVIPLGALAGTFVGFKMFVFDQTFHMTKTIWRNILATLPLTVVGLGVTALLSSRFGAVGCVTAVLVQYAAALSISVVQASRLVPIKLHKDDLARIGLMCAVMTVAVTLVLFTLGAMPAAVRLVAAILVGGLSYAAAGWVLKPRPVRDLLPKRLVEAV